MTIEAIGAGGTNRVRITCDTQGCRREEVLACDYERKSNRWEPNRGQANRKITAHGWGAIRHYHFCPKCEAARRVKRPKKKEVELTTKNREKPQPLRRPSREQKRQIHELLSDVYDLKSGRFKGADTDATIAEIIGDGCLPGWVAEIREDFFGPDGGNDEIAKLAQRLEAQEAALKQEINRAEEAVRGALKVQRDLAARQVEVEAMKKSLSAIRSAVGPKAMVAR